MSFRILLLLLTAFLFQPALFAQGENNVWVFGYDALLNFNSSPPATGVSAMLSHEGCASVCNAAGSLLFYSGGNDVRDRNHNIMPNGNGILSNLGPLGLIGSSTQGVAIMPFINDTNRYYLFVLEAFEGTTFYNQGKLRYNVIDMTLNGGLGDVVAGQKNIMLDTIGNEKMVLARGAGCYNWLICHKGYSNEFVARKIDASGISPTSVISASGIGTIHAASGEMKISNDYSKIAYCAPVEGHVELHSFNNATGVVNNPVTIDTTIIPSNILYGMEFSPDDSKLYYGYYSISGLYQLNLALLPNATAVQNSKIALASSGSYMGMRKGPDNKIYIAHPPSNISVINYPNQPGGGAGFSANAIYCSGIHWSLGNKVVKNVIDTLKAQHDTLLCLTTPYTYTAANGYQAYLWSNGDTTHYTTFTSPGTRKLVATNGCSVLLDSVTVTAILPDTTFNSHIDSVCFLLNNTLTLSGVPGFQHYVWDNGDTTMTSTVGNPSNHWVRAINGCVLAIDSFKVLSGNVDTLAHTVDTVVCFDAQINLKALTGYDAYQWYNGGNQIDQQVNTGSTAYVTGYRLNPCSILKETFNSSLTDFNTNLGPDKALCIHDSLQLTPGLSDTMHFLWQDQSALPLLEVHEPGKYWVKASAGNCSRSDTIIITERNYTLDLGKDQRVCNEEEIKLDATIPGSTYLWNTGSTEPVLIPKESGTYAVVARDAGCIASDSVNIEFIRCKECRNIPNAFSPNGDGLNDRFEVIIYCPVNRYELRIYDRWGNQVFYSRDKSILWDGRIKGTTADLGTYFYRLDLTYDIPGAQSQTFKGDITLIR